MNNYNKKRNTYFLYDVLVKGYVRSLSEGDVRAEGSLNLIKEFYNIKTVLGKEKKLYEQVLSIRNFELSDSEKISVLRKCKDEYNTLDKRVIFESQTKVLTRVAYLFGKSVLNEHVDDNVLYANIYQYLNCDNYAESIGLEKKILEQAGFVQENTAENKSKITEQLIPQYLQEQKDFVALYVSNNPGFQLYMYEQIKLAKEVLLEHSVCSECEVCDVEMKSGIIKIYHKLEELKRRAITEQDFNLILKVQDLVSDLKKKEN
jgi:hypothetical protein